MSTPVHRRHPAKRDALKYAKQLEMYTIKKSFNEKHFSKKKYRRSLKGEIVKHTRDCYSFLVKADACSVLDTELAKHYLTEATLSVAALAAQLDTANALYATSIPNIGYWADQIELVKEGIDRWMKLLEK